MTPALQLDLPTLLFVSAVGIAFSGVLLILARGRDRGSNCLGVWGVAMIVGAVGLAVDGAGSGLVVDGFGAALLMGATACSWSAARVFAERRPSPALAAAGPALWLLATPINDGSAPWTALACATGGAYTLAASWELWRTRAEPLPSRWPALVLLDLHGLLYIARGGFALLQTQAAPNWMTMTLIIEGLLHTIGMAVLLPSMVKDRAELRSSNQLRVLARTDGLTGVANRRHFDEEMEAATRRARRAGSPIALLMIDVDHFKQYNDAFGHPQGDLCLRRVAQAIQAGVHRPGDTVARYGGEEFAVLLDDTDQAGARRVAEAMRGAVAALGLEHVAPPGTVTVSIGVASLIPGQEPATGKALVAAADQALYRAKQSGRNTVCAAPPGIKPPAAEHAPPAAVAPHAWRQVL